MWECTGEVGLIHRLSSQCRFGLSFLESSEWSESLCKRLCSVASFSGDSHHMLKWDVSDVVFTGRKRRNGGCWKPEF